MDAIEYWETKLRQKKAELNFYSSKAIRELIRKEIAEIEETIKQLKEERRLINEWNRKETVSDMQH